MALSRRSFGAHVTGAAVGAALAACGADGADSTTPGSSRPAVLLVHGSWLGSWCYSDLAAQLHAKGISAFTLDLPGHTLAAKFPPSFLQRPIDLAAFSSEPSPLAAIGLQDYVTTLLSTLDKLTAEGFTSITVLGHSMAGIPLTAAAEQAPRKFARLVYLSAFMPVSAAPAATYLSLPENAASQVMAMLRADPTVVGALRLDTGSTDATYAANLKTMFCADATANEFPAIAHLMQPDDPIQPFATPTGATVGGWGTVPRTYIGCTQDNVLPPALQRKFVAEADLLSPANKTDFRTFASSHTPFFSQPAALAALVATLVK
jgi:pimeloyl-ACP methyl ester carboxylesterase